MADEEIPTSVSADTSGVSVGTPGNNAPPPSVLIVDDSTPLRRMLVKIIGTAGCRTHEANNGEEALELLDEHEEGFFSLILLDLSMPKMDGATFIQAAVSKHRLALPPIVVCSSHSDRQTIEKVVKMGVQGYLLKPFKTQNVIAKIAEYLPAVAASQKA